MITEKKIKTAVEVCKDFGATEIIVFGSASGSDPESARDLDIAVDKVRKGDIIDLAVLLEEKLKICVDIFHLKNGDKFSEYIRRTGTTYYAG